MEKQIVYTFVRNKDEKVCVSMGEYKDKTYVDFRIFFTAKESGELRPTKKGITIAAELLPHIKKAVSACEKYPVHA